MGQNKEDRKKTLRPSAGDYTIRDLFIFGIILLLALVAAHYFGVLVFIIEYVDKRPGAVMFLDEFVAGLLVLSIGLFIFLLRKMSELKSETAERMRLQEELLKRCQTEAEMEKIISHQLHVEVEERKRLERGPGHKPRPK